MHETAGAYLLEARQVQRHGRHYLASLTSSRLEPALAHYMLTPAPVSNMMRRKSGSRGRWKD